MERPYLIIHPSGSKMVADFVFRRRHGGACFIDTGWDKQDEARSTSYQDRLKKAPNLGCARTELLFAV